MIVLRKNIKKKIKRKELTEVDRDKLVLEDVEFMEKKIKENFEKVKSKIKELHSYDVPEIIQIDITNSSKKYLKFIGDNTNE